MSTTKKKKVTFYLDEDVLRAARVRAARSDTRDSEIVEEALRAYLGFDVSLYSFSLFLCAFLNVTPLYRY